MNEELFDRYLDKLDELDSLNEEPVTDNEDTDNDDEIPF